MQFHNKLYCIFLLSLSCGSDTLSKYHAGISLLEEKLEGTFKEHLLILNLDDCTSCVSNFSGFEKFLPEDKNISIVLVSKSSKKATLFAGDIHHDFYIDRHWFSKEINLISGSAVIYSVNKKHHMYDSVAIFKKEDLLEYFQ